MVLMLRHMKKETNMKNKNTRNWYAPMECASEVMSLQALGNSKGLSTGFPTLDEHMTMKAGTTLYLYGQPFSGKTEIMFDILIYGMQTHNWRVALFSPESGDKEEIFAEFISKYFRRPFYRNIPGHVPESHTQRPLMEFAEQLFIIDPGFNDFTTEDFFAACDDIEEHHGHIDVAIIDPWNELKHDFSNYGGRQDIYLEEKLGMVRRNAKDKRRINIICTHIQDQQPINKDGKIFYPPPTPRQVAGGQAFFRKGMNMIGVWRPPSGMNDENGIPYPDNEVQLTIHKFKPKGIGKRGTVKLYFDIPSNRYYEMHDGHRFFPGISTLQTPVITSNDVPF